MKVGVVAVCYNAYDDCVKFLDSLLAAYRKAPDTLELAVAVCDNSSDLSGRDLVKNFEAPFHFLYKKLDNIGYFPAFYVGCQALRAMQGDFDFIIVTNVDLAVDQAFFSELAELELSSDTGVVAPSILSMQTGGDINPKIIQRPSVFKLKLLRYGFSVLSFYRLHNWASVTKAKLKGLRGESDKRRSARSNLPNMEMYGAHGSMMIFTKNYVDRGASFDYPRFLFGEEVFVAEEARLKGLKTIYAPQLKVYDGEHGSTSKEHDKFISGEHVKSYIYLIDKYF
ncbi:MAG: glycosyltransferase [Pseudomonadota bacterium]|nr:glycosyltransferase [Pseudomonadota bacterium]